MGRIADTYRTDRVAWDSPFDVEGAANALRALGLRGRREFVVPIGPLQGRCHPPTVVAAKRTWFNNAWQPLFRGQLSARDGGSRLAGVIRPALFVRIFFGFWMILATAGAIAGIAASIDEGSPLGLGALLFPAFGLGLTALGARLSRGHRDFLRTTLGGAINGTEISTQGAST